MGARTALSGVYLDASAAVKLLIEETESEALATFLAAWPLRISSELLRLELTCVCHRQAVSPGGVDELLTGLRLLPLTSAVLRDACQPFAPPQRALDAVHLATAAQVGDQLGRFVSYDVEQVAAATTLGWRVEQPSS